MGELDLEPPAFFATIFAVEPQVLRRYIKCCTYEYIKTEVKHHSGHFHPESMRGDSM